MSARAALPGPFRLGLPLVLVLGALPALGEAAPLKVAIVPLREPGASEEASVSAAAERLLVAAAQRIHGLAVLNLREGRLAGPRAAPLEARAGAPGQRAIALGKEVGAERALAAELAPLADGKVLYLQAIDPAAGAMVGSLSVPVPLPVGADGKEPSTEGVEVVRGALVRLLLPARHVGRATLKADVVGAQAQIDGRPVALGAPVELPVGTHAVRVTHSAYRDFLRFVDVEFERTRELEAQLSAYPLTEGEMAARALARPAAKVPWYRHWWVAAAAGVLVAGATVGVVFAVRPGIPADERLRYRVPLGP